jgi:hypothetical protein
MAGEALNPAQPNRLTFAVPIAQADSFRDGDACDAKDRYGDPMRGIVVAVKPGGTVALVVLEILP